MIQNVKKALLMLEKIQMSNAQRVEEAFALLEAVEDALNKGVKHYNKAGVELRDVKSIIKCMIDEGGVTLKLDEKRENGAN